MIPHNASDYAQQMKVTPLLLLSLCVPLALVAAEGYKIVHPDGTVEFTDTPTQPAEAVSLPPTQGYQSTGADSAADTTAVPNGQPALPGGYGHLSIVSPAAEETLSYNEAGLSVSLQISPPLQPDHQVIVLLDGQQVAKGRGTSFAIPPVERGAHNLGAAIVDGSGNHLRDAASVTFYIFQRSIRH